MKKIKTYKKQLFYKIQIIDKFIRTNLMKL